MLYIDDPCHGFDDDPRSPYYRDPRPQVGVCDLCGEPIYEDERIVTYGALTFHYDCFLNMGDKDMAALFGFEITEEAGAICAYCADEADEWDEVVRYKGKTYHYDCFFNLPEDELADLLGFEISLA